MKAAGELSPSDFTTHPVWEYADEMESQMPDETYMRPVERLPVGSLANRLVGVQLTLFNAQMIFGILGNIELTDPLSTEHFLTVSVFRSDGERFDLARYHDVDHSRRDEAALAAFLGLLAPAVFPMQYDITGIAVGHPDCLRRRILATPLSRLSKEDLISMALR